MNHLDDGGIIDGRNQGRQINISERIQERQITPDGDLYQGKLRIKSSLSDELYIDPIATIEARAIHPVRKFS
jgi:hypothetical protein